MNLDLAKEVMACLPKGRTLFHYSKDDYAFLLLNLLTQEETKIQTLRQTPLAKLLEKPAVKSHLASCCNGTIYPKLIPRHQFNSDSKTYRLTLDIWGDDLEYWRSNQVSRKGVSLVLQMNLNQSFHQQLAQCTDLSERDPFAVYWHPVKNGRFPTLSWCRLDLDWESGEVLIEEIQSDLLRDFRHVAQVAKKRLKNKRENFRMYGARFRTAKILELWESDFSAHEKTWHEAMLSAALSFIVDELGLKTIYYHTEKSGRFLKRIDGNGPPTSLYTNLPKRFCFEKTEDAPELLQRDKLWKRKIRAAKEPLQFFRMAV